MLVSFNWIKQFVKLPDKVTPADLALRLTMSTVEVEGVAQMAHDLDNVVVGEILKIEKHPNADKLKLVDVNVGTENVRVVCGGSNLKKGMKVALGLVGAKVLWHGQGEPVELTKAKIRGEESAGMICASNEICLESLYPANEEFEVVDLGNIKAKNGTPLAIALGLDDAVFDIDNKSMTHRPDLWGHYGLAREVSALYKQKLAKYNPPAIKEGKEMKLKVEVRDHADCPRYMGVIIDGITVKNSPDWLQKRLLAVGLRPINNIVDITNYILFELGQPMHAFDARQIEGSDNEKTVIVRKASAGEKFITLDEKENELSSEMIVIADTKQALALAGVMGGENSGIDEETTMIVFESANFDPTNVRRTATALGIRTDSSARFEKSLDPNNTELALRKAVELTLKLCPGAKVVSNVADVSKFHLPTGPIELSLDFLARKMGIVVDKKQVVEILTRLGFEVTEKKDRLLVKVPTWRATKDISIPEDLVEEVARIYGYDNIEVSLPTFPVVPPIVNRLRRLERKVKKIVALEFGFTESYNYSFVSPRLLQNMGIDTDSYIELANPIAKDRPFLRRTLLPNLLENLEMNAHNFDEVRLYEVGKVFWSDLPGERMDKKGDELLPRQDTFVAGVFSSKTNNTPYYDLSEVVSGLLKRLGFEYELTAKQDCTWAHPGRSAQILVGGVAVGTVMELVPEVQKKLGIDNRVGMFELNLSELLDKQKQIFAKYRPVPPFPAVRRDVAILIDNRFEHTALQKTIKGFDSLIAEVELFDIFAGKGVPEGKRSLAYHIFYRDANRTLSADEADKIQIKLEAMLARNFGAEIRK